MDKTAIIEEIRQVYSEMNHERSDMLPDDITYEMVVDELKVSKTTATKLMKQMVKDGKFKQYKVRKGSAYIAVFRKE